MGNLTKNISSYELKCRCGKCEVTIQVHEPIIVIWQKACDYFASVHGVARVVFIVKSAARCYEYNRLPLEEGGPGSNDESQHPRCCAIDGEIRLAGGILIPPIAVYEYFVRADPDCYGLGLYSWGVHFDTRAVKARW